MSASRRSAPWLVALLAAALSPLLVGQSADAHGGRCAPGDGVTVVVDYGDMRSGVDLFCDTNGGGKTVTQIMDGAGVDWQYTSGQPFVCRIEGTPTQEQGEDCVDTPPPNAYWGLFWSDGSPQTWAYSARGAASLRVPEGGSVGWRFQDDAERDTPGAAPTARPQPSPKPKPSSSADGAGSGGAAAVEADPTRAPASRAPDSASSDAPPKSPDASAAKPSADTAGSRPERAREDRQRRKDDRTGRRIKRAADDVDVAGVDEDTDVTAADSELVQPVTGGSGGPSTADLLLLSVAGLAAAGLAAYGVVTARRRRI